MIKIHLEKEVTESTLFDEIKKQFPLLKDVSMSIVPYERGKFLQINTVEVSPNEIKKLLASHSVAVAKKLQPLAEAEQQEEEPGSSDQKDFQRILEIALSVPGAKEVIEASLAVMSCAQEVVSAATDKILGNVAVIEKSLDDLKGGVGDLKGDVNNLRGEVEANRNRASEDSKNAFNSISDLKTSSAKHAKAIDDLKSQVTSINEAISGIKGELSGASSWMAIVKEAMSKAPVKS